MFYTIYDFCVYICTFFYEEFYNFKITAHYGEMKRCAT